MLCYPNAKINLGLAVTGRRADGYHTLETVFCPIALCDALEIEPTTDDADSLYLSGQQLSADESMDNLVTKALAAVRTIRHVPPTAIALYKAIPTGAGLGGGSADAAFMLRLLDARYKLALSNDELHLLAQSLGADCPFFLLNKPILAHGIGDELTPLPALSLSNVRILLIKPPFGVSTPQAYSDLSITRGDKRPNLPAQAIDLLRRGDLLTALPLLRNDFEPSIFRRYPRLSLIKHQILDAGARCALMSGSGSTIFGLFDADAPHPDRSPWADCFVWEGAML